MSERELAWLATTARNCERIVEFGSFHGRSTRALADNSPDYCKIWAVDPWNGEYPLESGDTLKTINTYVLPLFKENLRDHIDTGKVIPVRGFSTTFVRPTYEGFPLFMDMVFIDGDHRYETVRKDIKSALKMLRIGGIVCGHDFGHPTWPGVKKAVDEFLHNVQIEDTIWWARKF